MLSTEKRHIFIVDDDPGLIDLLRYLLKKRFDDFEITTFTEGQSVSLKLATCIPEVIVTDVLMPGMSGVELMYKLSSDKRFSKIKVIAITGLENDDPRIDAVKLIGLYRIVYKETSFTSSIVKAVEDAISGRSPGMGTTTLSSDDTEVYEGIEELADMEEESVNAVKRQPKTFNHESILELMDGDFQMLRIAPKTFLSTSSVVLEQIENGIKQGNAATAARAAHTMAGAAGSVGGERLKNICSKTESHILSNGCKDSQPLLSAIKLEFAAMTKSIMTIL